MFSLSKYFLTYGWDPMRWKMLVRLLAFDVEN